MRAIKNVTSSWNWPNLSASNCCTCPPTRPTSISSNACGNSSRRIVCTRPITTTLRSSNRPSHPVSLKLKPHTGPPSTPCFPTASRPLKNQKLCQGRVYKNGGRELCAKSSPEHVNVYDFVDPQVGRATPYGVYDITQNKGWVSVGISFDTGRFAVNTLRQWWLNCGEREYAGTQGLLVNADGGGSNGSRVRLWKTSLQEFADEIDVPITVCHYPPGTSKWNPIEHRMFAPISANWRAKPLRSFNDVTQYIRATTTKTGLTIDADVDGAIYQKGVKITKKQINALNMTRHAFHGEWNYTISPTHAA